MCNATEVAAGSGSCAWRAVASRTIREPCLRDTLVRAVEAADRPCFKACGPRIEWHQLSLASRKRCDLKTQKRCDFSSAAQKIASDFSAISSAIFKEKLKGKIGSALFRTFWQFSTLFHTFSEFFRIFPPGLFLRIMGFYCCFSSKIIKENKRE